jgi:sialate O-acetylesterase
MKVRILLLAICFSVLPTLARADVKPNALCTEGMVLQQKSKAKIWGTANKGEQVSVTFRRVEGGAVSEQTVGGSADNDGRWAFTIDTGEAGGPFELTIKGNNTITYKNVLVGEVWICSGQSNMEWKVRSCDKSDKEYATSAPANPMLRIFNVTKNPQTKPQTEIKEPSKKEANYGKWIEADPKTVGDFTAAGYFFGRNLQEMRKVPVGLIDNSWGGTRIETWMSKEALGAAEVKEEIRKFDHNSYSALYNGMLHPLLPYKVKGAIWYQGESNTGNAYEYRKLHPTMIETWRAEFKNPDLAFYFVQLAPFTAVKKAPGDSNWAELREAQTMTLKLKNTGMAVITDYGCEYDIHPTPKRPVGERLALAARAQTYGEKIVYSGPMYKSAKFADGKAVLSFDHIGGGLDTESLVPTLERKNKEGKSQGFAWRRGKEGAANEPPLVGFTICGKDSVFHNAKAEIVGNTVVVSSDKVAEPTAVRYGWANHPICNLYNREGLPASPFRTDDFSGITQPKSK